MTESNQPSTWERAESVEKFANRDPDLRLMKLLDRVTDPASMRVLDLGCAAGRNTVELAEREFDFQALDGSRAMIERTMARVTALLGEPEAGRRVHLGRMDDLSAFADAAFDLVVALGIFHCASSRVEWDRAMAESVRVLAPEGRLLISVFTPETDLEGKGIRQIPGEPHVYSGFSSGRTFLVDAPTLDTELARRGLDPAVPTKTVRVEMERGRRVVVNALYKKG